MSLVVYTEPSIEPVTRAELKSHMRLDTTDDSLSLEQSIVPGAHVVAAAYGLEGSTITVAGYDATVYFDAGSCTGGTVNVKIQESDDDVSWTDVSSFTEVTADNDNAVQESAYTGGATYIRAVATVADATCEFSVSVAKSALTTNENTLLDGLIKAARQYCEAFTGRTFITTTNKLYLDSFPATAIDMPSPPLQSITSITYTDTDGDTKTLSTDYYTVDTNSTPGRIVEAYGYDWPSTRDVINSVTVTYVSGYGDEASDVPEVIKLAIKHLAAHWYENRESTVAGTIVRDVPCTLKAILWNYHMERF